MSRKHGPEVVPRIGGPLPVLYRSALAWFYPEIGHGRISVTSWADTGHDEATERVHFTTSLGPFDDTRPLQYAGHLWQHEVARMVAWPDFLGVFPAPSKPSGVV